MARFVLLCACALPGCTAPTDPAESLGDRATATDESPVYDVAPVAPVDWPLFRGDTSARGVASCRLPKRPDLLWTFSVDQGGFEATATLDDRAAYVPLGPPGAVASAGPSFGEVAARLWPLIGEPGRVAWISWGAKRTQIAFAEQGVDLAVPHFDVEIASQLLDPSGSRDFAALALRELGWKLRTWGELAGRGARAKAASELPEGELAEWAGTIPYEILTSINDRVPRLYEG